MEKEDDVTYSGLKTRACDYAKSRVAFGRGGIRVARNASYM